MKDRSIIIFIWLFIAIIVYFNFFCLASTKGVDAKSILVTPSPSATYTSTQTQNTNYSTSSGRDDTMVTNLISAALGAAAVIIAAFITIWLPVRLKRNKNLDEQKQKQNEEEAKSIANTNAIIGYAQNYRKAIYSDKRISTLQILDMKRPLDISSVYIQVKVHGENRLGYRLKDNLIEAEKQRDPNTLLKLDREIKENRLNNGSNPESAISYYKHCIIVGDPGAGKSTLLKYLALMSAKGTFKSLPDLPIHIELNAFATSENNTDLLSFAASTWESRYHFPKSDALDFMKKSLANNKAILLLDALDEAVIGRTEEDSNASYNRIINMITDLASLYSQAPIVITVRKAGYYQRTRLVGFTELEVLDFSTSDTETSPYAGVPLSEEFIRDFFVHEAVTKEVIETIVTAKEVWSGVQNVIDHQIRTRKSVPQFMRKNLLSEEVLQFFEVKRTIQELIRDLYEQQNIWNELHELVVSLIEGMAYYHRHGAAIPFSEKVLLQFFNTLKPTKEMVEVIFEQGTIWEVVPTGMGYYTILYQNEKPNEIVFAGFSGD